MPKHKKVPENQIPIDGEVPEEYLIPFNDKERAIARLYFSFSQPSITQVAKETGFNTSDVWRLVHSEKFLKLDNQMCQTIKKRIKLSAWRAYERALKKGVEPTTLKAAEAVLEDAGELKTRAENEINIFNSTEINDPEAEARLKELGKELANRPKNEQASLPN